jgi:PilZ domain
MAVANLVVDESVKQSLLERWTNMRGHQRVTTNVKLRVEWDEGPTLQNVNAVTVDVSSSGCKAVVAGDLRLHQRVKLVHAASGRRADAQVVWRGHEAWDAGFVLEHPDPTFWE